MQDLIKKFKRNSSTQLKTRLEKGSLKGDSRLAVMEILTSRKVEFTLPSEKSEGKAKVEVAKVEVAKEEVKKEEVVKVKKPRSRKTFVSVENPEIKAGDTVEFIKRGETYKGKVTHFFKREGKKEVTYITVAGREQGKTTKHVSKVS